MSIWVKRIDVDEDAFEIDLEVATSTSCVKSAICRALRERFHIETSTVTICVANEKKPLVNTKDMVSVSEKEAGHSFILPYLFSIHQNVPAGVVIFSEVKPHGATRNVLSNRQQSARSLACALLPMTGARETAFMDECFAAGKTALAWQFRELLEDWEHKPQGFEGLKAAVYVHVPCKELELSAEAAAVQRSLAYDNHLLKLLAQVLEESAQQPLHFDCSSCHRFVISLFAYCGSRRFIFHIDDIDVYEKYGDVVASDMINRIWLLGDVLKTAGHFIIVSGRSKLLRTVTQRASRTGEFTSPNLAIFIPLPSFC